MQVEIDTDIKDVHSVKLGIYFDLNNPNELAHHRIRAKRNGRGTGRQLFRFNGKAMTFKQVAEIFSVDEDQIRKAIAYIHRHKEDATTHSVTRTLPLFEVQSV